MSERDAIRPISAAGAGGSLRPDREVPAAQPQATDADSDAQNAPEFKSYRVIMDPETLRAVTEVRDPVTGKVLFTVPAGAEISEEARRRYPEDEG